MTPSQVRRLVAVPAVLTLAVTLLRLTGELAGWDEAHFSRAAGGNGALVGIVWLIPFFGAWFGWRLAGAGLGPERVGRALGHALVAFALNTAFGFATFGIVGSPVGQLAVFFVLSVLATLLARPGWPELWRVLVVYAVAARVPVLVVMLLSIFLGWDTHYAKPRPDWPPMGPWGIFFWTGVLPQLGIWIYMTVVPGMIFGTVAAVARRVSGRPTEPVAA